MTDDEVYEFLRECLDDLGEVNDGEMFLLAKPSGATESQWSAALKECGVVPA